MAGAPLVKREMLAAVSSNAVELILGGLAQPEEIVAEHNKVDLLAFSITGSTAGLHRHVATQCVLVLLPAAHGIATSGILLMSFPLSFSSLAVVSFLHFKSMGPVVSSRIPHCR